MLALVIGTGRSGTTLVQETLSRHRATGFISGLDDKFDRLNLQGALNGRLYRLMPQRHASMRKFSEATKLLEPERLRIAPSEGYRLLNRYVMSGFASPCRDLLAEDMTPYLRDRLVEFFTSRIEAQHCDLMIQHLTGWPRTGFIAEAFPDVKVVNVVRDGRAVANSWLQMGWWDGWSGPDKWIFGPLPAELQREWEDSGRSFAVLAALGWKMLMEAYELARERHPAENWLDVHYEDILSDPREWFGQMLDFLGLDWDADFEEGYARHEILGERVQSYRSELTGAQIEGIELVLDKPLRTWGYQLNGKD